MKTIRCTCPSCGAKLSIDADHKTLTCPYCGEVVLIDDETIHVKPDDMEQAGYEFEKGRQKAIKEESTKKKANTKSKEDKNESRNKTLMGILIILLAIMFFPLIVTIYLVKEKKFQPKIRYAIIVVCWIAWMPLAYTWINNKNADNNATKNKTTAEPTQEVADTTAPVITLNEEEMTIQMSDEFDPLSNVTISDDTTTEFVQIESEYSAKEKGKGWYVIDSKVDQERPSNTYLVKITAGDSAGNKTSAQYSVNVTFDSYQGEVVEDETLKNAMLTLSNDNTTSDFVSSIADEYALSSSFDMGFGGTSYMYTISNSNLNSGYIYVYIVKPSDDNYTEHLRYIDFVLYGIEDDKNLPIAITYHAAWERDSGDYDGEYGYYIGEQYYGSFDEAYSAYISMKN